VARKCSHGRYQGKSKIINIPFENKVVLITGTTSGIGKASTLAFAESGAKVVVSGRRETEGQTVVAQIKAGSGEATGHTLILATRRRPLSVEHVRNLS